MEPVPNRAPKLNTTGSLEDLLSSYAAVKAHASAKYEARKNDSRLPGEKRHTHEFDEAEELNADANPHGATYLPCSVEGCTAELHPSEDGSELHHNGKVSAFKGNVTLRQRKQSWQ